MIPWKLLDSTTVPGDGDKLLLYQRADEFSIKARHYELMNSRVHGSEDALAELACRRLSNRNQARILIGGLGMGFTLAAALRQLNSEAEVTVAELVPAIIAWNKDHLAALAGHPLDDPRVTVFEGDVGTLIRSQTLAYDAILLDVDNGPEGLTRKENDALYSPSGLSASLAALRPAGIFGVWSISPEPRFSKRLRQAGFNVEEIRARAHSGRGGKHMIWLGQKTAD